MNDASYTDDILKKNEKRNGQEGRVGCLFAFPFIKTIDKSFTLFTIGILEGRKRRIKPIVKLAGVHHKATANFETMCLNQIQGHTAAVHRAASTTLSNVVCCFVPFK